MNMELTNRLETIFDKLLGVFLLNQDKENILESVVENFGNVELMTKVEYVFKQLESKMRGGEFEVINFTEEEADQLDLLIEDLLAAV